jgi:hypothetical protein
MMRTKKRTRRSIRKPRRRNTSKNQTEGERRRRSVSRVRKPRGNGWHGKRKIVTRRRRIEWKSTMTRSVPNLHGTEENTTAVGGDRVRAGAGVEAGVETEAEAEAGASLRLGDNGAGIEAPAEAGVGAGAGAGAGRESPNEVFEIIREMGGRFEMVEMFRHLGFDLSTTETSKVPTLVSRMYPFRIDLVNSPSILVEFLPVLQQVLVDPI